MNDSPRVYSNAFDIRASVISLPFLFLISSVTIKYRMHFLGYFEYTRKA